MTTQRDDTKVLIDKWRLDNIIEMAREVLESTGKVVSSTITAADVTADTDPELETVHDFAVKDAARSYNGVMQLIEQMKLDIKSGKEVAV